jgi:hypothetical protein
MAFTSSALATELTTDPTALGYAATVASGADQATADIINLARVAIQIKRSDITPSEIFHALDLVDLVTSPTATVNSYMESLLTAPFPIRLINDDGSSTPVQTNVLTLLKTGSTGTKTRLAALQTRAGSRAEFLWGAGFIVTAGMVATALRG